MKKRLLAILLSLMMVLSLLPVGVFAADAESIGTGEELAKLFTDVHAGESGSGNVTVTIDKDYDLTGYQWKSLTVQGYTGAGVVTVEGNNHKITGLNAPLFAGGFAGTSGIVVKNLTLTNVTINDTTSNQGIGAFINNVDSMPMIELDDCHLTDSKITSTGGARVGGLIGWTSGYNKKDDGPVDTYITVKNCSVENTEITAKGSVGGIIGHAGCNPATFHTFTNNTVTGCTLNSTDDGGWRVGVVVGTANVGEVTITGTKESSNNLTQTGRTAPEGQSNLYGRFVPNGTGKLVIDDEASFGTDYAAAVGTNGYKTVAAAVAEADGKTVTLLKDVTENVVIPAGKTVTLDLNGKNIKPTTGDAIVNKGNLTIVGSGEVAAQNSGSAAIANFPDATANVNGGTFVSASWYVIKNLGNMTIDGPVTIKKPEGNTDTSSLIDNGWYGSTDKVAGESVSAQADKAKLTIKSGEFTGKSGSASCSVIKNDDYATLDISGGTFDSTNNQNTSNSTTILNWNVATISGGTFIGQYPLANGAYKNDADKGQFTISGGTFTGLQSVFGYGDGGNGVGLMTITGGKFTAPQMGEFAGKYELKIFGGTFSADPTAYVPATHHVEGSNPYTVKEGAAEVKAEIKVTDKKTSATVDPSINETDKGKIEAVKNNAAVSGVAAAVRDDRKVDIVAAAGVTTTDIGNADNKIETEIKVNVKVTEADLNKGTMTFEASPVATVKVNNNEKGTVPVPNEMLNNNPITVKLPLPTGFEPAQIKHISENYGEEYFLKTPKTGAKTFEIKDGCAVFTITHFSTFEMSGTVTYVEPVYTSAPITKKDVKFDDVDVNAYYAPAVKWAVENKITAGKTDKLFAPDDTCTRGEMITFLWNAAGKPAAKNTTNPFTDVNVGAFYYDAVLWAVSNGITSGTSDTTFSPDNTVSRAQVVAFLYNYANKPAAANSTFSDVAADAYYAPAVGWAAAQKITSGTGNNTFSPENDCTRAQIVTFLYNDLAK